MISYKQEPGLNVDDALGPDGLIASARPDFESRPQQLQMAHAVKEALNAPHHLAVEAGTGVGKSFAYLIPAIDYVVRKQGKVLVSTYTITLQQQLINKDVPFLAASVGMPFSAELPRAAAIICAAGMNTHARKKSLFGEDAFELMQISEWAKKPKTAR